mmetsp:Transcript_105939/g.294799  ORF Transcript_105939/g.294799 Transcript_105939/m.294799 type:complete len:305 (-) Transcript_105939:269-1183(-)
MTRASLLGPIDVLVTNWRKDREVPLPGFLILPVHLPLGEPLGGSLQANTLPLIVGVHLQLLGVSKARRQREPSPTVGLQLVARQPCPQGPKELAPPALAEGRGGPRGAEESDPARGVLGDAVGDELWAGAVVGQDAVPPVLHHEALPQAPVAIVAPVQPAAPGGAHAAVVEAGRRVVPGNLHAPLDVAPLEQWLAQHDVNAAPAHELVPAAEGHVGHAGVLAGAEAAHAEAREDQGALPTGRLHDHLAAAPAPQEAAILRDTDALGVGTRPDQHQAASVALAAGSGVELRRGPGEAQAVDGGVD